MVSVDEARRELARRELARRSGQATPTVATPRISPEEARAGLARRRAAATTPSRSTTFANALGDIMSFGLMDEAVAGAAALLRRPFSDRSVRDLYQEGVSRQRGLMEADERVNPGTRLAGQVAGGVFTGGRLAPLSASARVQGAPLLGRMGAASLDATMAGSLYGLGSADDEMSRPMGALTGGLISAPLGFLTPVAGALIGRGVEAGRSALAALPIARAANTSPETLRTVRNIIQSDDLENVGRANIQRAGAEGMLADAGPTAQSVLDTAIQRGGPGARLASERIRDRVGRDAAALSQALDTSLGQPQGVTAARTAIRQGSSNARQQAYDAAYSTPIDYASDVGRKIENLIQNRVPASAIQRANALMRAEGAQSQQIAARIADDGTVTFDRLPDVRQIDYITRALNDIAESGEGAGALGGMNALGRVYSNLSRELRSSLREAVPEYGRALEVAADPIRRSQAVRLGSEILSPRMTRDQVAEAVQGMTGPERDALAQGLRSQIDDLMARVTRTVADDDMAAREAIAALRNLSSRANREKLAIALGEERVAPMLQEIDRAAQSFNLRAALTGNSRTYGRLATAERVGDMTAPGPIGTLARGEPVNAGKRIIQALTGQTDEAMRQRQDAIYSEIADILTRQGMPDQSMIDAVQRIGAVDDLTRLLADRASQTIGSPAISYPAAVQLQRQQP